MRQNSFLLCIFIPDDARNTTEKVVRPWKSDSATLPTRVKKKSPLTVCLKKRISINLTLESRLNIIDVLFEERIDPMGDTFLLHPWCF